MRFTLLRSLPAIAFLGAAILSVPVLAQGPSFTPPQRTEIGEIVRDYLLKNPELLTEVIAELEKRQTAAQRLSQSSALKEHSENLLNAAHSMVVGNPAGDVTLVEFFDYNCGYCKKALGDVRALIKGDPNLRIVLKDFPVLGPDSVEASRVALAVKNQIQGEKLLDYHVKLMDSRGRVNGDKALAVAKEMGLDVPRLQKDMVGSEVGKALAENAELGDKLGLTGTPAFVVGEEVIPGAVGLEPLRQVVANTRRCGKALCS